MRDSFWSNWGESLDRMAENRTLKAGSLSSPPSDLVVDDVITETMPPAAVTVTSERCASVSLYSVRLPSVRVRVRSVQMMLSGAEVKPDVQRSSPGRRSPARKMMRRPPPAHVPLRERITSVLQPPIATLLGDSRFWLPFAPFPYQYEGIHFLMERWAALLADEMGLGKTMQTILAIRVLVRCGLLKSVLLVCPKPLMTNWMREFALWADEIPVTTIRGDHWTRRTLWIHDQRPVKITNYESLRGDEEILNEANVAFDLVVLDEAQRIKNPESRTARAVHGLRRRRSWALTGTPIENRASDLISLLQFVHNGDCNVEDRADLLRDAVSAVLLRRTKDNVMTDLPEKLVRDVYLDLGPAQRASYDAAEKDGVIHLNELGEKITVEHVFELIGRLKQICNFDPVTGESAKAEQLQADLEEIAASGQKAILFSQYVTTLEQLAKLLAEFQPLLCHGKVPQRKRDQVLAEFRERDDRPVLMLSYGTGAVGLNLQFSNYVFLYDRWWNPAIEDQAINRAHRVGQKDRVFVSRFVTPDTIEGRIAEVLEKKRELFSFIIDDHESPTRSSGLSREDVFGLFDLKIHRP